MDLLEQAKHFLESKGFIVEGRTEAQELGFLQHELGFQDVESANVFYYIGRLITNKGPQTKAAIEKYLNSKFNNKIPNVGTVEKFPGDDDTEDHYEDYTMEWEEFLRTYFSRDNNKWGFTGDSSEWWDDVAKWHDEKAAEEDPNAKYVKLFWDWYKDKKAGGKSTPNHDMLIWIDNTDEETVEKAFGKYYKFAMSQLEQYLDVDVLTTEDKLIQKFWDWHRAKKDGKPYQLDQDTIDGLVTFLRKPKAVEVLQQYYYYFVRVIEKLSDKTIKTPINTTGLQKELQRIMDNLDNDDFVDELEKIERNRLRGGDMTAGPIFVLPTEVVKSIRTLAKDTKNIDKAKVGKIDKSQVKECYAYCINELNRKFHVGKTGIFDLNIQDFYDTYKIVFQRGFNTKTLHKIFDEVSQYLLDQLDKGTADYWKNRGKIEQDEIDDFNEAYRLKQMNLIKENSSFENYKDRVFSYLHSNSSYSYKELQHLISVNTNTIYKGYKENQSPDETALDILDGLNESKNFNVAYKALKSAGYVILEDVTDEVLQHGLSPFDKAKLEKGQKPSWAKSVTELGPRPKRPKGSSDWTERAWRSVRGEKEPYKESDWRRDNELNLKDNQDLEERLKAILNIKAEFEATKDKLNVYVTGKRFEVECRGLNYIVKMFGLDSVFNRNYATVKSLSNVAKFIEENV